MLRTLLAVAAFAAGFDVGVAYERSNGATECHAPEVLNAEAAPTGYIQTLSVEHYQTSFASEHCGRKGLTWARVEVSAGDATTLNIICESTEVVTATTKANLRRSFKKGNSDEN